MALPQDKQAAADERHPPDLLSSPPIIPIRERSTVSGGAPPTTIFWPFFLSGEPSNPILHNKELIAESNSRVQIMS